MGKYKDAILLGIAFAIFLLGHSIVYWMDKRDELKIALQEPEPITVVQISEPKMEARHEAVSEPESEPETEPQELVKDTNVPSNEKTYTEAELEALALVIYQEAGGDACSDETRIMVGNVVMNRVADERFPGTIEEVLLAKRQYGRLYWTGLVWPERASRSVEAHAVQRAYDCAERVLNGERLLPEDVIWQAEFVQGTEIVAQQDGFYFCR